jgi:hypothetical protein
MTKAEIVYRIHLFFSRLAHFFSSHKYLYTARWAFLHEVAKIAKPKHAIFKKFPGILLAMGRFDRLLCVLPTKKHQELTNVILLIRAIKLKA